MEGTERSTLAISPHNGQDLPTTAAHQSDPRQLPPDPSALRTNAQTAMPRDHRSSVGTHGLQPHAREPCSSTTQPEAAVSPPSVQKACANSTHGPGAKPQFCGITQRGQVVIAGFSCCLTLASALHLGPATEARLSLICHSNICLKLALELIQLIVCTDLTSPSLCGLCHASEPSAAT